MENAHRRVFAAIDVGTNAARIKIARLTSDGRLKQIDARRDPIRPGEGVFKHGAVAKPAAERLFKTLSEYASLCRSHDAEVRAVATSALREADNREAILRRVRRETGVALDVISGREEARLMCLGALAGSPANRRTLCLDIGGGSTEVVMALGDQAMRMASVPMGAVRLAELLDGDHETLGRALPRMRITAAQVVRKLPDGFTATSLASALGCSGTIRALVAFASDGERTSVRTTELPYVIDELASLRHQARVKLFGAARAETLVAGAVVLEAVAARLRLKSIEATRKGLRDGILIELIRKRQIEMFERDPRAIATC